MDQIHTLPAGDTLLQRHSEPGKLLLIEEQAAMALLRLIAAAGVAVTVLGLALSLSN